VSPSSPYQPTAANGWTSADPALRTGMRIDSSTGTFKKYACNIPVNRRVDVAPLIPTWSSALSYANQKLLCEASGRSLCYDPSVAGAPFCFYGALSTTPVYPSTRTVAY